MKSVNRIETKYNDENIFMNSPYSVLKKVDTIIMPNPNDVLIDLGCGTGRTIAFFSKKKLNKITGIEISKKLCEKALIRLNNVKKKTDVQVINDDVLNVSLDDGTIYYMYNPFGIETFKNVIDKIRISLEKNNRKIIIVYYNPVYEEILYNQKWLQKKIEFYAFPAMRKIVIYTTNNNEHPN